MRITLNAQKLSFSQAYHSGGISRYIYELLRNLRSLSSLHHFTAFAPDATGDPELASTERFRLITAGASAERAVQRILWEQLILPWRLAGRSDLHHGLAFALPLGWPGRSVVTIFDLSFLRFPKMFNRRRLRKQQAKRCLSRCR